MRRTLVGLVIGILGCAPKVDSNLETVYSVDATVKADKSSYWQEPDKDCEIPPHLVKQIAKSMNYADEICYTVTLSAERGEAHRSGWTGQLGPIENQKPVTVSGYSVEVYVTQEEGRKDYTYQARGRDVRLNVHKGTLDVAAETATIKGCAPLQDFPMGDSLLYVSGSLTSQSGKGMYIDVSEQVRWNGHLADVTIQPPKFCEDK